jgi:hypothetical protein
MIKPTMFLAAAALMAMAPAGVSAYQVFNAAADFNLPNPNGAWGYELYRPSFGTFVLMNDYLSADIGGGTLRRWKYGSSFGSVTHVSRPYSIAAGGGQTISATPEVLILQPDEQGIWAGVVFTAPKAASYVISGSFQSRHSTNFFGTSAGIYTGSAGQPVALDSGPLTGVGAQRSFNFTRTLAVGERLGFWVDPSVGFYSTAATGLDLTITDITRGNDVPEPDTWAMMIAGFGLVGGMARRRRAEHRVKFAAG